MINHHFNVCIVDGGAALHKAPWTIQSTYTELADAFVRFILSKHSYNERIHVVFDGYDDALSLKNLEHTRRGHKILATNVALTSESKVTATREAFLCNTNNKKQFIKLLCQKLLDHGITNSVSVGDADVLIVKTAVEYAKDYEKVVVASDNTDILIMLIHHFHLNLVKIYFCTERKEPQETEKA